MLLAPLPLFWLLLLLAFALHRTRYEKWCRMAVIAALAELFIFSVTPLPVLMMENLEKQYPVYNPKPGDVPIPVLVLGGGHTIDNSLEPLHRLSTPALARLTEGIRQQRSNPGSKLVLSGYSESGRTSIAETMGVAALSLGISQKDTLLLTRPGTTWEEAQAYKKRFGTSGKLVLVTSASHMPRAMETFRKAGLNPIAAPAYHQIKHNPDKSIYSWGPSSHKLQFTQMAMHEYVGIIYYRWFKK
ncbi:ElyC/SanA/YdcF family protein [uncultured Flavobacterium sp.]|uniref:YdcF family protein n=1 Tax=uncultured Flavobacterium sp. TaxID=165435 RepID=UPI0025F75D72|nr:ElyC/SanA/YdcF family protein [uncultured Flavobacterium sp.]